MNKNIFYISFIFFALLSIHTYAQKYEIQEIHEFTGKEEKNKHVLKMAYASPVIQNKDQWKIIPGQKVIKQVDLIFTKYPLRSEDWITNYDSLLNWRKTTISKVAPEILNNPDIKWNIILQTKCKTEVEAKNMFHGAILTYEILKSPSVKKISTPTPAPKKTVLRPLPPVPRIFKMDDLVGGKWTFQDSIVLKVFNRHPEWKDMLVVNDWTGSMYEYGAQTVLWHKLNIEKNAVKQFVFFNDGDDKKDYKKVVGATGGIYLCSPENIEKTVKMMNLVMERGNGGDIEENDLEAIINGMRRSRGYGEVILIADNKSHVRDMALIHQINKPVRVILCGAYVGGPVLPDYLELARKTGGSIHTIEQDIVNLAELKEGDQVTILGVTYVFRYGRFERLIQKPQAQTPF